METAWDGRKRILFLYVLFLCVAYINKSIYKYELAVEFCIFESSKSPLQDLLNVNDLKKEGLFKSILFLFSTYSCFYIIDFYIA